jgi:RNA polymerase sigma-70 factor (ECF subfamily)
MAQPQPTEERLIERACAGEHAAQRLLWHAHRRWVAAIVLAHRPRTIEVDDLMQDVAVKFIAKVGTLRDAAAFRPWLRQIVINVCRGAARGRRSFLPLTDEARGDDPPSSLGMMAAPVARNGTPSDIAAERDAARLLLERALTLPPEYREPLLLRCVRSLSYQQIGEILGLPVTTIETRLARARRMLREEVGEEITSEECV